VQTLARPHHGHGDAGVVALDGATPGRHALIHRDHGPVGFRQEHVSAPRRRPRPPTSGSAALGETELRRLSERRLTILRRRRIGFVFEAST